MTGWAGITSPFGKLFEQRRRSPHAKVVNIAGEPDWHRQVFSMLSCDARDQVACTAAARGWRAFERPMPEYFAEAVRQANGGLVIDVGANTGFYSLLALSVSRDITVAAYEPMRSVRAILRANLRLNAMRKRVSVLPYAASDTQGRHALFVPDAEHGLVETSASLSAAFKGGAGPSRPVRTTTLDAMHHGRPRVAVVKVDAEGHDLQVLRGAAGLLRRDRPVVFVEVLLGADEPGLTQLLDECGYADSVLRPQGATSAGDTVRHDAEAWNHMWLPRERMLDFRVVLD